jgi:putative membrane protein
MYVRSIALATGCVALLALTGTTYGASLSNADKQFLIMASKTDMTEAHEGKLAEDQATSQAVKDLGKTLVEDHTESYRQLTALASKTGVSIETGIDASKDRTIQQLTHLKGDRFDREFAKDELAAHRQAIAVYKREAEHGQDADIKEYASKMIPVLEKHLHLAEECAKPSKHS